VINELQRRIRDDFNLENPKLQVEEIDRPALNAQVMASKLASALERGWYFRRAGHSTVLNIVEAGAKGCLIILSGKLTGSRHRTEKFLKGHIKFCGEIALTHMDIGFATAVKKLGTIGCTVAIMKPGAKLPHEVEILTREEAGLEPYVEPSPLDEPVKVMEPTEEEAPDDSVEETELTEEEAETELAAIAKLAEEQAAVAEEPAEDGVAEEPAAEEPAAEEPAEEPAEEAVAEEPAAEEAVAEEPAAEEAVAEEPAVEESAAEEPAAEEATEEAAAAESESESSDETSEEEAKS
jgi:small subunit ribosomal protein S3